MSSRRTKTVKAKTYVVVSDVHVPSQSVECCKAVSALMRDIKPDGLIVNGDFLDLIELSSHARASVAQLEGLRISETFDAGNKLLDEWQQAAGSQCKDNHFLDGNHECLSDDTQALTRRGWLNYSKILVGDEVLAFDTKTQNAVWKKVTAVHVSEFDGTLANLVSNRLDFLLTPNHRVLIHTVNKGKWEFCPVSDFANTSTRRAIPICGNNPKADYPGISLPELRLLGWVLTDGWIINNATFGMSQRESKAYQVRQALKDANVPFSESRRHRNILEIADKVLKKPCEAEITFYIPVEYGRKYVNWIAGKKEIPVWVSELSQTQFNALLEGMLGGNGTKVKSGDAWVYYPSNEKRGNDLQALLVQNGWSCAMKEYRPTHWRLSLVPGKITTQLCAQTGTTIADHFIPTPYKGTVWCLSVSELENFCVRRNGKVCFTGNSRISRWLETGDNAVWLGDEAVSISSRLKFKQRSFKYHEGYPTAHIKLGHLIITHGRWTGKYAAAIHLDRYRYSVLVGHVHTPGSFYAAGIKQQAGFVTGHLADASKPALSYAPQPNSWRNGFAVVVVEPNGNYHVQLVNFVDGVFYFGNKRYGKGAR